MKTLQKGFTLIELMIVVAIIGILAAVAIPAYQDYIVKAKLARVQSTLDPLKLAIGLYYQENGSFPGGVTATTAATVDSSNTNTATGVDAYWTSLGMAKMPAIPSEISSLVINTLANSTALTMTLTVQNIKAGACASTPSAPTSSAGIDGCTFVITATPGSTAINWVVSGEVMSNVVASKYFK